MVFKLVKRLNRTVQLATAAGAWYLSTARPWLRQWGATDEEVQAALAGDDVITHPRQQTTRAVTVQAPPKAVWPHVLDWAQDPAGFATPERLAKLFDRRPLAREPGHPQEGEAVAFPGQDPEQGRLEVVHLDEGEAIVLRGTWSPDRPNDEDEPLDPTADAWVDATWAMVVRREPDGGTRLLVRTRIDHEGLRAAVACNGLEPVQFLTERRALLEIQERAEADAAVEG